MNKILILFICVSIPSFLLAQTVKLTGIRPVFSSQRVGSLRNAGDQQGWIPQIGERKFADGLNTYANSEVVYILNAQYAGFEAWVGIENGAIKNKTEEVVSQVDGAVKMTNDGKVIFQVFSDGVKVYDSGIMDQSSPAKKIQLTVSGVTELSLIVKDMATGGNPNHSNNTSKVNWAEPVLTKTKTPVASKAGAAAYSVKAFNNTTVKLDAKGNIIALIDGYNGKSIPMEGKTYLADAKDVKFLGVRKLANGTLQFSRIVSNKANQSCRITETFSPATNSVRWETDIEGQGAPYGSSIVTAVKVTPTANSRFWTAWSHPDLIGQGYWNNDTLKTQWADPLQTRPFTNSSRWYGGNPLMYVPTSGDLFTIPMASVLDSKSERGFTIAESPVDTVIYMKLVTTEDGSIQYQRRYNRIEKGKHVKFAMDLITHEDDWRSGMAWMTNRYPDYFNPVNALGHDVGGAGAYSSWEGELEAEKLKKMAFKFNWKASFDFPYMGMFLPPSETWQTFATSAEAKKDPWVRTPYKGAPTSRKQLEAYSKLMRGYDFHVLNYFNVTEFGTAIKKPTAPVSTVAAANDWNNANLYLQKNFANSILYDEDGSGNFYYTWGDAVVMDPGAKEYQDFMVEQAQRHVDYLPSSTGICIDRMDWLRYFNINADDDVTWYEDKPVRSLYTSWNSLMERLGPVMHNNNKVIYLNPMTAMRLDAIKHGDGIYSEHNELGPGLNSSVFLGMRMPVVAWTWDEKSLQPDPDFYLQRFLYLGVFPSAPVPDNNHEISPGPFVDSLYLTYGPLFNAIKSRTWMLKPHMASVAGNTAKINVFEVPGGYVLPVVMAGKATKTVTASITLDHLEDYKIDVLVPGHEEALTPTCKANKTGVMITVPVVNECAVIRLVKLKK